MTAAQEIDFKAILLITHQVSQPFHLRLSNEAQTFPILTSRVSTVSPRLLQQTEPAQAQESPRGQHGEFAHQLLAPGGPCTDDISKTNDQLVSPTYSQCLRDCAEALDFFYLKLILTFILIFYT